MEDLKKEYAITDDDERRLTELKSFGEKYVDDFLNSIYDYILNLREAKKFLPTEEIRERHRNKLREWFLMLFSGKYDNTYLARIYRTGEVHVRIGLPPHLLHAAMNNVREYFYQKLTQEFGCSIERDSYFKSVQKLLDLNLDIMVSSYRDEELKLYLASMPFQRRIIEGIRRLIYSIDFFIIIALLTSAAFTVFFIIVEMERVAIGTLPIDHGALSMLGSTLILYAISELLSAEIKRIRGGVISLKVFVGVALAATIRKVLVMSLLPEESGQLFVMGFLLLVLGVVLFIIHKAGD